MRIDYELELNPSRVSFRWTLGNRTVFSPGAIIGAMLAITRDESGRCALLDFRSYDDLQLTEAAEAVLVLHSSERRLEVRSRDAASHAGWMLQASARGANALQMLRAPKRYGRESRISLSSFDLYSKLEKVGVSPDFSLRLLTRGPGAGGNVSVCVDLATGCRDERTDLAVAIDCGLQLACFLATERNAEAVCLVEVERVVVRAQPKRVSLARAACSARGGQLLWDVELSAPGDEPSVELRGIRFVSLVAREDERVRGYAGRIAEKVRELNHIALDPETDDLVSAGLTSLGIARLLSALSAEWGWAPPLGSVSKSSSCLEIARAFAIEGAPRRAAGAIRTLALGQSRPLSSMERRLWYLERVANAAPSYNEAMAWRIRGRLDLPILQAALNAVVSRHDALRTSFPEVDGAPSRRVHDAFLLPIEVAEFPLGDRGLDAALMSEVSRPFTLVSRPPIRVSLLRINAADYVLMVVAHHIICDGTSAWMFRDQLGLAYSALVHHRVASLPEAAAGISQRTSSQGEHTGTGEVAGVLDWWERELDGVPEFLDLPTDEARPAFPNHAGDRLRFEVDRGLTTNLRELGRKLGVTPFELCLAAFQVLLRRYSRQASFVVAVPMSTRSPELADSIGCFINTVPMRADFGEASTLLEAVKRTAARVGDIAQRLEAPFEAIVARLRRERCPSHAPLTQVSFSYHEHLASDLTLEGVQVEPQDCDSGSAKFELSLMVEDSRDELRFAIEYRTQLFHAWRIRQMSRHFTRILAQLIADPSALVDGVWLLSDAEGAQLLALGLGPQKLVADYDVRALTDRRATEARARPAIIEGARTWTYGQMDHDVTRLAGLIVRELGESERIVAIQAARSYAWAVGVLAILRSGRAYLPIDSGVPEARTRRLFEESGAGFLLFARGDLSWNPVPTVRCLDVEHALSTETRGLVQRIPVNAEDAFYLIATSGSTGAPKLACASYGGVANLIQWYSDAAALDERSRVLVCTSPGFDLTQKNLLAGLACGSAVILYPPEVFDPRRLAATIARERISHLNCTPSMFQAVLEVCSGDAYRELESLEVVVLGGEVPNTLPLLSWLRDPGCRARLINSYGPSECTDVCAAQALDLQQLERNVVPIGRPIPNVRLAVLDERGLPVPFGVRGELFIAGSALASAPAGARGGGAPASENLASGYASGDIVRYLGDGRLVYEGRRDQELKLRAYRINPYEIESRLAEHPDVAEAAVAVRQLPEGSAVLCAYHAPGPGPGAEVLREWLASALPQYMVPSIFVAMDQLPLNRSGKVDRGALPAPVPASAGRRPHNELEERLLEIWRQALGVPALSVENDFFLAGGHSLLAVKVAAEVERATSVGCRPADIFANASVERLARLIARRGSDAASAKQVQSKPGA